MRVMLVDSDEVTLAGMTEVLKRATRLEVVAAVESGEAALELLDDTNPDVVFVADRLKRMSGAAACAAITQRRPATAVVVLSVEPTDEVIAAYVLAGARGFLTRGAQLDDLAMAARGASHGTCFLSPSVADRVIKWAARAITTHEVGLWLSPQEIQILTMVEQGLPNRTIARRVGTSLGTLKGQLSQIMRKLGATRRADAVTIAIKRGLIPVATAKPANVIPIAGREPARAAANASGSENEKGRKTGPIRVVIVDDREVVREGLVAVLSRRSGIEVSGDAPDVSAAVPQLAETDPDLVLVGGRLRQDAALALCRVAADLRLRTHVLVLAGTGTTPQQIREALMWGARGCLVGDLRADEVESAIRALTRDGAGSASESLMGWEQLADVGESARQAEDWDGVGALNPIEASILRFLSEGKTNPEIAEELALSLDAVKRKVKGLYKELHVSSRAEAAAIAVRQHLI